MRADELKGRLLHEVLEPSIADTHLKAVRDTIDSTKSVGDNPRLFDAGSS